MQVSFNITLTTDELINGKDWIVKIPGFGKFVVELNGTSDYKCNSDPVRSSTQFCFRGHY